MTDNYKYKGPVKTALTLYNRYVRGGRLVVRLAMYLFLSIVSFVFLFPFLYMIITSLKSPYDLYDATVNWIPSPFSWRITQLRSASWGTCRISSSPFS